MTGAVTGWVKLFFKRYNFKRKVSKICRTKGYSLEKNGFLWWLGKNKSGKCNFTVSSNENKYSVKLIGVRSKNILFGFIDENFYEIKDYTFALPHTMDSFEYTVKKKEPYRFDIGAKPCLVMVPDSAKVTVRNRSEKKDRQEIGSHDFAPEGEFFTGEKFLVMLEKE